MPVLKTRALHRYVLDVKVVYAVSYSEPLAAWVSNARPTTRAGTGHFDVGTTLTEALARAQQHFEHMRVLGWEPIRREAIFGLKPTPYTWWLRNAEHVHVCAWLQLGAGSQMTGGSVCREAIGVWR